MSPEILFKAYKNSLIDISKQYGEAIIPTSVLFQIFEDEIWVFPDLDAQLISLEELQEDLDVLDLLDEPLSLDIDYDYTSIDFEQLLEEFKSFIPAIGFADVAHIEDEESHLIWIGNQKKPVQITCGEDLEKYCFKHIKSAMDQLHKNFFTKIQVMKSGELIPMDEKIRRLIPYWGESGLDCYYINVPKDSEDLNDGILLASYFSIYETEYLEEWIKKEEQEEYPTYNRFVEILFILYRVCIKIQREFANHPMFHKGFQCYPCSQDMEESFNNTFYTLAEETLELPIEEYLSKCKETFESNS